MICLCTHCDKGGNSNEKKKTDCSVDMIVIKEKVVKKETVNKNLIVLITIMARKITSFTVRMVETKLGC